MYVFMIPSQAIPLLQISLVILFLCVVSTITVIWLGKRAPTIHECDCEHGADRFHCKLEAKGEQCVRPDGTESSDFGAR